MEEGGIGALAGVLDEDFEAIALAAEGGRLNPAADKLDGKAEDASVGVAKDVGEAFVHGANDGTDGFLGELEEFGGTADGGTGEAEGFGVTRELKAEEHIGR